MVKKDVLFWKGQHYKNTKSKKDAPYSFNEKYPLSAYKFYVYLLLYFFGPALSYIRAPFASLGVYIGRLTAFYVIFVPMEYIPSEPPHSPYVIVSFLYFPEELIQWNLSVTCMCVVYETGEGVFVYINYQASSGIRTRVFE